MPEIGGFEYLTLDQDYEKEINLYLENNIQNILSVLGIDVKLTYVRIVKFFGY